MSCYTQARSLKFTNTYIEHFMKNQTIIWVEILSCLLFSQLWLVNFLCHKENGFVQSCAGFFVSLLSPSSKYSHNIMNHHRLKWWKDKYSTRNQITQRTRLSFRPMWTLKKWRLEHYIGPSFNLISLNYVASGEQVCGLRLIIIIVIWDVQLKPYAFR